MYVSFKLKIVVQNLCTLERRKTIIELNRTLNLFTLYEHIFICIYNIRKYTKKHRGKTHTHREH